jgi:hypothetical protein
MKILERFKFEFTINTLFIGFLILIIGGGVTSYYLTAIDPYEVPTGALPVPIQVGKNKIIVSKTGDASMRTEYNRRKAIIQTNVCRIKDPKFGFWNKDSTNGTLESYFLTSIYNERPRDKLYDGKSAYDENTFILNGVGSGLLADGGDAYTEYCIVE